MDDYGYLDFELDEEYKKSGEYDDEDDEDEDRDEENEDEDEEEEEDLDDEEEEELYGGVKQQQQQQHYKKEVDFVQQTIQKNAKEFEEKQQQQQIKQVRMGGGNVHHVYNTGSAPGSYPMMPMTNVYTIPEEEEPEEEKVYQSRRASIAQAVSPQQYHKSLGPASGTGRRYSVASGIADSKQHQLPTIVLGGSHHSNRSEIGSATPRLLPFTSSASTGNRLTSASVEIAGQSPTATTTTTTRGRSYRSNSEPFLPIVKPLKRGKLWLMLICFCGEPDDL